MVLQITLHFWFYCKYFGVSKTSKFSHIWAAWFHVSMFSWRNENIIYCSFGLLLLTVLLFLSHVSNTCKICDKILKSLTFDFCIFKGKITTLPLHVLAKYLIRKCGWWRCLPSSWHTFASLSSPYSIFFWVTAKILSYYQLFFFFF